MRITKKTWLLAAVCLLMATTALADLRPPVEVRLLGEPHAVVPGETYKGQLELVSDLTANLADFRFEGRGWRELQLDVPRNFFMDKGGRLVIDFELAADNNVGPLEFIFELDGYTVRENLDLSAEHLAAMSSPGAVKPARDTGAVPAGPELKTMEVPAPTADEKFRSDDDDGDGAKSAARTIRVHGRFVYQRSDGVTIGADGVAVRVYDEDTFVDDLLGTVATDAQGYYDLTINTSDAGETNPDLYVNFKAANSKVDVTDATWNNTYAWQSGTMDNYSGSDWNLGWTQPSNESDHPALHILTDVTRTWRWTMNHEGYDTPAVACRWPDGAKGAWYSGSIHVGVDREWNEATHSHEWGHHWIGNYAVQINPDYCNGICDNNGCGHCIWCEETDHDAFSEGWPNWLADVLTRSYLGDYGIAPQVFRNQENISACSTNNWDDPLLTEGFLGALLRDIEDTTNDDHAHYPGYADVMSWGTNEIFDVVDFDHSTTPMGFLNDFKARFPNSKEALWETAKNCGYEIDVTAPGTPTGLSSSHSTTGDSPDPTIYYSWSIPTDDASGIAGYGIYISTGGPGMPGTTQDIGDVSSYTTTSLAPGTYYFNLRAVDRAGRWSSGYATYGPVTIRAAEPSDLTYRTSTGWDYPIVPRNDSGSTSSTAAVSPTLDGNIGTTRWSVIGKNQGESSTSVGFQTRLYVDNVYKWWMGWGTIGAGGNFWGANAGPITVTGGRHTFEAKYDATDQVSEVVETNNVYAHQFIWTPLTLARNTPVSRSTPPELTGGWDSIVDLQPKYYNCDGLEIGDPYWWNAVVIHATDNSADYDVRLHEPTTDSQNGFGANLGFSSRAAGCLDAVLVNRNVTGAVNYDAGVLNWGGNSGGYVAEHVTSSTFAFGDSLNLTFGTDQFLMIKEFNVPSGDLGDISITVDVAPGSGPVYAQWRDKFFDTGALTAYNLQVTTNVTTGRARLDFNVAETGFNSLVLFRDPKDGNAALTVTVEIQTTPADFKPLVASGWHSPVVPRIANDGTPSTVALPDTLYGNAASTYLNLAVTNASSAAAPLLGRVFLDGVYKWWLSWGSFPGNGNSLFNWGTAWTVRGGRHTLDMRLDPLDAVEEIWENNNIYGEQYVWSPLEVAMGTQVTRSMPPDLVGGWDEISSGEVLWYNCDGLRMSNQAPWWQAVAVMPGPATDVDVRLHNPLQNAKDGFNGSMARSGWGSESSDFSLVNYNLAAGTSYDAGVLNISGSGGYTADHVGSNYLGSNPTGQTPDYTIPAGSILALHEVNLTVGTFSVALVDDGGGVDWGLSVMPADAEFMSKSSALAASWTGSTGTAAVSEEIANVAIPANGYYCIVVWKAKTDDLAREGSYHLVFGDVASDVPGNVTPSVTALHKVYPNPFNPQTTIVFDLAKPARTEIAIYDLKGSLVRTLRSENLGAGRHEVIWRGNDNHGQRVASGVYMARMRAGDFQQMKKLMLVK